MDQYMLGDEEEGSNMIEEMDNPLEEDNVGPTSIDVTDEQISIGPTSIDVTDAQPLIVETPPEEPQEVRGLKESIETEQVQEQSRINKGRQKRRRITSYLSDISKQVERQGHQINKMTVMIQSLQKQKQKQTKSTTGVAADKSQLQSINQIKSQINQLQKQVARIQNDIQKIPRAPVARTRTKTMFGNRTTSSAIKPRSKKSKLLRAIKVKKGKVKKLLP